MTDRQGIEIDYCPQCRGVWLDRGELDKLIERAAVTTSEYESRRHEPSRVYDRDDDYDRRRMPSYGDHEYNRKNRKRSFLGDLFDFD
jgi:uncharacterized protein